MEQIRKFLSEKKSSILNKWFERIVSTYPLETQKFLRREKDRFANPVRSRVWEGIEGVINALIKGDESNISTSLDNIIRIRAVQDFTPAQALAFIFFLKKVVREELAEITKNSELLNELLEFENKIDELALLCFNIYMQCREKIYEIRVNEIKRLTYSLLKRANLIYEIPDFKDYKKTII